MHLCCISGGVVDTTIGLFETIQFTGNTFTYARAATERAGANVPDITVDAVRTELTITELLLQAASKTLTGETLLKLKQAVTQSLKVDHSKYLQECKPSFCDVVQSKTALDFTVQFLSTFGGLLGAAIAFGGFTWRAIRSTLHQLPGSWLRCGDMNTWKGLDQQACLACTAYPQCSHSCQSSLPPVPSMHAVPSLPKVLSMPMEPADLDRIHSKASSVASAFYV